MSPYIPRIYNTTDNVIQLASQLLRVNAVMMTLHSFANACYFIIRSGGNTMITFFFDSVFSWTFCVSTAYILAHFTDFGCVTMMTIVEGMNVIKMFLGFYLVRKESWVNHIVT